MCVDTMLRDEARHPESIQLKGVTWRKVSGVSFLLLNYPRIRTGIRSWGLGIRSQEKPLPLSLVPADKDSTDIRSAARLSATKEKTVCKSRA